MKQTATLPRKAARDVRKNARIAPDVIAIVAQIPWSAPYFYIDHIEPVIKFTS